MSHARLRVLLGVLTASLVAVVVAGALLGSASIADDLRSRAEHALTGAGIRGVSVDFDGREARLSGRVPSDLRRAELVVEGIDGVRFADVSLRAARQGRVAARDDRVPTVVLRRTPGGVTVAGTVPDADAAADIKVRAAEAFAVPVTGDLGVKAGVGDADWVDRLPDVFGDVAGVKDLRLVIDGVDTLELGGTIESEAGADRVLRLVSAAVPDLDVISRLDVVAGDLSEVDAAVLNTSTLTFAPGSAALDADLRRTLAVVADVLLRNARVSVEVGGHAGPGDPQTGERLSAQRVAAVEAYLVGEGVSPRRVSTRTYPASRGAATDPSAERHRRVDLVVKEQ